MKLRIKFFTILNILILKNLIKLTAENFAARLKQADLVNRTNIDNKLTALIGKLPQIKQKRTKGTK